MCIVRSPWVSLYVTPVMLKSAALSRDLWYTHWMCSGSSPSRTTPSKSTYTQTRSLKKGLKSQESGLLSLFVIILNITKDRWTEMITAVWFIPPKGISLGHSSIRTYSMQCSGKRGMEAIVHMGKLIYKNRFIFNNNKLNRRNRNLVWPLWGVIFMFKKIK